VHRLATLDRRPRTVRSARPVPAAPSAVREPHADSAERQPRVSRVPVAETQIASVNAMIWSIRMLGMFSAPMLGAVFYSVGGAPAPTLVVAGVAAVLYLYSACFQMPRLPFDLQPPANPDQASVFDLWRVGPVWLVQAVGVLCLSCLLSYEPLLNPVLSGPPFNLSYTEIGVFALIGPICSTLAAAFCARMYRSIGKTNQLWLAAVCLLFAVACYGPSRLLPLPNSFPLMVTYFVVVSVGNMIGLSILPVLLLDILWSQVPEASTVPRVDTHA
jgi:hypothetical protein